MNPILIHKSDSTVFANVNKFLTFFIDTNLDLTGYSAKFILGWVEKTIDDISTHSFEIILGAQDTKQLRLGKQYGTIILTDSDGNIKTVTNTIPFEVTTAVVENEYQEIDLTIPESSGVDIRLKVGASTVTSVNGMTGDVVIDIPNLEGYVKDTDYALDTKAGVVKAYPNGGFSVSSSSGVAFCGVKTLSNYQNSSDTTFIGKGTLENIKDDYIKRGLTENTIELTDDEKTTARTWLGAIGNTDYAGERAGVFKPSSYYGVQVDTAGYLRTFSITLDKYKTAPQDFIIGKGTLENVKDDYVKRALTQNTMELTEEDKASTKQLLGYATPNDIMQAIASIPQFNLSIVEELPLAGEKMTLYLVPKEGTNNDVYDEYIWIEQTESFEHLGTTAVDLTDYVKNTDYASSSKAGVVKTNVSTGVSITSGLLYVVKATDDEIKAKTNLYKPIVPSNLDYAVKTGVTTNTIELTDDEKSSARTWIGAISNTDFATGSVGGVVKTSGTFACNVTNGYLQTMYLPTIERYNSLSQYGFIGKGTLETVLTQYSKTVLTTEADYNALETKDANTLYLIEE